MHRISSVTLAVVLSVAMPLPALAAGEDIPTREDIHKAPNVEVPRGDVVEKVIPGADGKSSDTTSPAQVKERSEMKDAKTGTEWHDPSLDVFTDVQTVIDSVRSKTDMPDEPLSQLDSRGEVHLVPLSSLSGTDEFHAKTLDTALEENSEAVRTLRDQARLNIFVVRALEDKGYTADDVLTWATAGTDDVTIVVDDRRCNQDSASNGCG